MEIFPKCAYPLTHPRVFARFGKTKGEIRVEKGNFRGDLGGFWGGWALFGNQPPYPPTFGRNLKKKVFILGGLRFKFEDNLTKRNGVLWAIFSFIRSSCVFYSDLIHTQAHQLVRCYDCLHWPLAALLHISKGGLCYWVYNRPLYSYIYIYIASSEALVSDEANYRVAVNVCCCQNETGTFS